VHLVGSVIRIYHDARSPERQTMVHSFWSVVLQQVKSKMSEQKEGSHFQGLCIGFRLLKWILINRKGVNGLNCCGLGQGLAADSCGRLNKQL